MNKNYIDVTKIENEVLKKIFDNNSKLKDKIRDRMFDDANFWANEYISSIRKYIEVNSYDRLYINRLEDYSGLLSGLNKMSKDFDFFYNMKDSQELYHKAVTLNQHLEIEYSEKTEDELFGILEDFISYIDDYLQNDNYYCYNEENQKQYLLDYSDLFLNDKMYYDNDFVLYEDIVKSYK